MKILVLGGAGMLGHQVFAHLVSQFGLDQIACTLRKRKEVYSSLGLFAKAQVFDQVDLMSFAQIENVLSLYRPQWIINCVGLTLRKKELTEMEKCIEINSMLPHRLEKWAAAHQAKVIHFSTDCVFDGSKGNYSEKDMPSATDLYGKSKFLGEIQGPHALTLRLSIVGRELEGKTELVEWFLSQRNLAAQGYAKAMYSGLTTNQVAKEVVRIIKDFPELHGLYQIASEPISKFQLLQNLNEIYNLGIQLAEETNYAVDKTLDSSLYAQRTGFKRPAWRQMLLEMKKEEGQTYGS